MKQSKIDSFMESVVNIIIGLVVSTIANYFVLPGVLGVQMSLTQNLLIGSIFTAISLVRSYAIRRAFNGRSVWTALKGIFTCQCVEFTKEPLWYHRSCVRCGKQPVYNGAH